MLLLSFHNMAYQYTIKSFWLLNFSENLLTSIYSSSLTLVATSSDCEISMAYLHKSLDYLHVNVQLGLSLLS